MDHGVSGMQVLSVTIARATEITGLGSTTIFELLKAGRLRSAKIGSRRLVLVVRRNHKIPFSKGLRYAAACARGSALR
jgi:hypothetical protein